ncbi:uncharacterized protein LOC143147876 [Ptiloglossa arizonensis]|uniref:uncharacterized protein LOC143147876 n=1 Tax=Ptiloglossa arizonensis TaxID=3350558 RepID=UPI003F9F16A2
MRTLRPAFFLVFFTMVASRTSHPTTRRTNDLTTTEKLLNDMPAVTNDLQESVTLKKRTLSFEDIKSTANRVAKNIVDLELAKLEAIRAAKIAFLETMITKILSLVEELPSSHLDSIMKVLLPLLSNINDMSDYPTFTYGERELNNRTEENNAFPITYD